MNEYQLPEHGSDDPSGYQLDVWRQRMAGFLAEQNAIENHSIEVLPGENTQLWVDSTGEDPADSYRPLIEIPHTLYAPERYEAAYSYPLLVWLHGAGESEADASSIFPAISDQNYLGVALRGSVAMPTPGQYDWPTADNGIDAVCNEIHQTLDNIAEAWNVHPDRIYLAGRGTGGTTALRLLLTRPGFFAGAINVGGAFPIMSRPLARLRELRDKRVLMSLQLGQRGSVHGPAATDLLEGARLLYNAGMEVATRVYQPERGKPTQKVWRDIDSWLMDSIKSAIKA